MDGFEGILAAGFYVQTHGIHDAGGILQCPVDAALVVDVGSGQFDDVAIARPVRANRMASGDAHRSSRGCERPDDAAAQKSRASEHCGDLAAHRWAPVR